MVYKVNWFNVGFFDAMMSNSFMSLFEVAKKEHSLEPGSEQFNNYYAGWLDCFAQTQETE